MTSIKNKKLPKKYEKNYYTQYESIFKNKKFLTNIKRINFLNEYDIQNNSNLEEDDYNFNIYDKSISKNEIFLYNDDAQEEFINKRYNTISSFNSIKKNLSYNNKNNLNNNNSSPVKINLNINNSFEEKSINYTLEGNNLELINNNNDRNYKNLIKNINLFYLFHKSRVDVDFSRCNKNNLKKNGVYKSNGSILLNIDNQIRNDINFNKSKFSKINNKHYIKLNNRDYEQIHNKNQSYYKVNYIHSHNNLSNKDKISNINCRSDKDFKFNINNNINFKMFDGYVMNPFYNNILTETERELLFRNSILKNKFPIKKIDVNINHSDIYKNFNFNNTKEKKNFKNYFNLKKQKNVNYRKINPMFDKCSDRNKNKIKDNNEVYQAQNIDNIGHNKIIKKRIILEEEYMINPNGEKTLLSVKRIENKNNHIKTSHSNVLDKYFKKENRLNIKNEKDFFNKNNKLSFNNELFSNIFKNNLRESGLYQKEYLRSIEEDTSHMYINNNYPQLSTSPNVQSIKQNMISPSNNINKKIKMVNNYYKKREENININTNINNNNIYKQKINSDLNKNELENKKKLFYTKINLLKDKNININNKIYSNNNINNFPRNNNLIRSHTDLGNNNNRIAMNYIEDKNRHINENNRKIIYGRIPLKQQIPLINYHNDEKNQNQNFIINNNQSCPNLVNIVFFNHKQKNDVNKNQNINKYNELSKYFINKKDIIPEHTLSSRQMRNNYRFHEIKSVSIDISSGLSTNRNLSDFVNNRHYRINDNISSNEFKNSHNFSNNSNSNFFSSMDHFSLNKNKYNNIFLYESPKKDEKMGNIKGKFNKRCTLNNNVGHYLSKYN